VTHESRDGVDVLGPDLLSVPSKLKIKVLKLHRQPIGDRRLGHALSAQSVDAAPVVDEQHVRKGDEVRHCRMLAAF
jgi:hypothetical protein